MTDIELAIVQSVSAFVVLLSFVITAAILLLTLIESYLVVGGGVLLLGLGANRFTAPAAEGYFGYVIRVGVRLLFFICFSRSACRWRTNGRQLSPPPVSPFQPHFPGGLLTEFPRLQS